MLRAVLGGVLSGVLCGVLRARAAADRRPSAEHTQHSVRIIGAVDSGRPTACTGVGRHNELRPDRGPPSASRLSDAPRCSLRCMLICR